MTAAPQDRRSSMVASFDRATDQLRPETHDGPRRSHHAKRKLLAIVVADVVGYTRLMQADEDETHARMMALRAITIEPQIAANGGRFVKSTGDGFVAVFETAEDAVRCAIAVQGARLQEGRADLDSRRISFRIGINVADVIVETDDVYGDGVNIAARLQTYAEPGGIVVTSTVADQIAGRLDARLIDLGELPLRNLSRPVRALSLQLGGTPQRVPGDVGAGLDQRPSIVVLPFVERGVAEGGEYFAEGIVDDIVHALSGLKELFVIARGSSLGLQAVELDVRQIGRELDVRYVLRGSIQRADARIRISTELYDVSSGTIVASDRYDGEFTNIFDLQRKIASRVVSSLAPQVRERERLRVMRKHPQNMTAFDFLLQALDPLFAMDLASFSTARGFLQRAISNDPEYGPAYSYLAYWYLLRVGQGWSVDAVADTREAFRMAQAAIERDGNDALSLAILGHVHSYLLKDYDTAVEFQDRALELGPSCAMAWTLSSVTQGYLGNGPTAVLRADNGLQLSPRGAHVVYYEHILSQAHYINGNFDEALRWARRAQKHNDRLTSNVRCLIVSLVAVGAMGEARQFASHLMTIDPGFGLDAFARQTPLLGAVRDTFVERLRQAGLPD